MKIEIGKKYKTRNGLLTKVKSVSGSGDIFYGVVIGDDGGSIDREWSENGLTNDSIINHPYELMYEVKFIDFILERIFEVFIDVFAFSLVVIPVLTLLLFGCCLVAVAFNLLFKQGLL